MHMLVRNLVVIGLIWSVAAGSPARAGENEQDAVIGAAEIDRVLSAHADEQQRQRRAVMRLLSRGEVQATAARSGVDLDVAKRAVETLEADELQRVAELAAGIEQELEGGHGSTTIQISVITLLLLIIIVILLAD